MWPPAPLRIPPSTHLLRGPNEYFKGGWVAVSLPVALLAFVPAAQLSLGAECCLLLHRSLALRDLFRVKMLVLPGPTLFPGGCPVLFLVRDSLRTLQRKTLPA